MTAAIAGHHPPRTLIFLPSNHLTLTLTLLSHPHPLSLRVWVWGTRNEGKLGLGDDLLSGDEGEPRLLDMLSSVQVKFKLELC